MKNKITQACDHIGLYTNNSKKMEKFYLKILGLKKEKEEILPKSIFKPIFGIPTDCKFIRLYTDNMKLEIFEPVSARARKKIKNIVSINHWGFCVENSKKFVQKLKIKKVKIIEVKKNEHTVYFLTDPDGNRIEIRECYIK
jgi:catechol 2,3-dioxygenase-like lactoylglutathione lyase family enzyme